MENEKISGKSTEPHNESDTSKVAKDIRQVESKGQSELHEPSSNPLIHANETQRISGRTRFRYYFRIQG